MRMFSPVFAASSWRSSSIVFESCFSALTWDWSSRATSLRPLGQLSLDDLLDDVVRVCRPRAPSPRRRAFRPRAPRLGDLLGGDELGRGRGDVQGDLVGEGLEVLVAGDEVGLALDLDHRPDLVVGVDVGGDDTLVGAAPFALGGRGLALDPQDLDRPIDVAVGLGQGAPCSPSSPHRYGPAAPSHRQR